MIKITGKLWLLTLCLSLIVSIPLASADENDENKRDQSSHFYKTGNKDGTGSADLEEKVQLMQKVYVCSKCDYRYVGDTPPDKCPNKNCNGVASDFNEVYACSKCGYGYAGDTLPDKCPNKNCDGVASDFQKVYVCPKCGYEHIGDTPPDKCPKCEEVKGTNSAQPIQPVKEEVAITDKPDDPGIFHTILTITPWLLVVLCLIFVWKNIFFLRRKLDTIESQLKEIIPTKSEGSSELNTNRPKGNDLQLEERVSELEKVVFELKEAVKYLLREWETRKKENKEDQRPQESSQLRSLHREIPANNQRIHTEGTTRPDQLLNKSISTSNTSNKLGLIPGANRGLGLSPEIQKIIIAFNKMMLDSTKLDESSMELWKLRNNFIENYKVIAFKCVNSQERVNHPEEQPRFEMCRPSESTLWCIKLSDGTFAVLPGLREYESTAHFQGGMKELFNVDYKTGTYRKIEVVKPAIVKRDFSINEQGELRLRQ